MVLENGFGVLFGIVVAGWYRSLFDFMGLLAFPWFVFMLMIFNFHILGSRILR